MKIANITKKDNILKQKKIYIILISLIILGIILGISYIFFINDNDLKLVKTEIKSFFNLIKTNKIDYESGIINSLSTNILYCTGIWLLGISIIGIPIVIILLIFKSFIMGFSISSIINIYGFKGILGALTYIFPHQLLFLLIMLLISFYSINFSIKLFKYLFLHKNIDLKNIMKRYIKIYIISIIGAILISLIEIYLSPYIIKLFTYLI